MAVDVGALIAESIERAFSWNALVEHYALRHLQILEQSQKGQLLHEAFADPDRKDDDPDYRRGYKTGWRAAHEGRPNEPSEGGSYGDGYNAGYEASGNAQQLLQHHAAGAHDAAADHAMGTINMPHYASLLQRGGQGQNFQDAFMRWDMPRKNEAGERVHNQSVEDAVKVINRINQSLDTPDEGHDVGRAPHPADYADALGNALMGHARREQDVKRREAGKHGGQSMDPEGAQPIAAPTQDPGQQAASAEVEPQQQQARAADVEDARKQLHGILENLAFGEDAVARHDPSHPEHQPHPGIEEFRQANHQDYDSAVGHAHDLWKRSLVNHLRQGKKAGVTQLQTMTGVRTAGEQGEHGTPHLQHTGHAEFDPVAALEHSLNSPQGFRSHGWVVRAAQSQPGFENFTKGRSKRDPNDPLKNQQHHPGAGQIDGALTRALGWLHEDDRFNPEHGMWDYHFGLSEKATKAREKQAAKQGGLDPEQQLLRQDPSARFKKMGKESSPRSKEVAARLAARRAELRGNIQRAKRKAYEEAIRATLKVVEEWLQEKVQIPEGGMIVVMEEIFSRVQATYGVLFEGED